MAILSYHKVICMFVLYIFLISVVLQQTLLADASRSLSRFPPPPSPPTTTTTDNLSFDVSKNKYEKKDIPPVTPGHSPGMGHDNPPGAT